MTAATEFHVFVLFVSAAALVAAWLGVGRLIGVLNARAIVDVPNDRSSHTHPTPRGAGFVVIPVVLTGWIVLAAMGGDVSAWTGVLAGAVMLFAVSVVDDVRGVSPIIRFAAQWVCVGVALAASPLPGPVFQGAVPPAIDAAAAAFVWVWFVNAFNFMDGIDGIAGVEAATISAGLILVGVLSGGAGLDLGPALVVIAAVLGFLRWNWHPAKIFLGDAGSTGLGFLIGWLLLITAAQGHPIPALILPLYFLADSTATLVKRAGRGETLWQAHREHFYQRAVQAGHSHAFVTGQVLVLNLGLVGCAAIATVKQPAWIGLGLAFAMVVLTLHRFAKDTG